MDLVEGGGIETSCSLTDVFNPLSDCTGKDFMNGLGPQAAASTEMNQKMIEQGIAAAPPKM